MTLSTQLRLIILAVGALILALIYLLGRRRDGVGNHGVIDDEVDARKPMTFDATTSLSIDEDEFDEPSYLRRSGGRRERNDVITVHETDEESLSLPSVYIDPPTTSEEPQSTFHKVERVNATTMRVPVLSMQDPDRTMPMEVDRMSELPVEVINQSTDNHHAAADSIIPAPPKIIALRLAMSERVSGEQLLAMFQAENLQHGEFNIFHRLHNAEAIFSVASMTEPGTFDLAKMIEQQYAGVTLFMQLPGSVTATTGFEQMLSCAQRLSRLTSGVIQDEAGVTLLESGIERLREKMMNLEQLSQA